MSGEEKTASGCKWCWHKAFIGLWECFASRETLFFILFTIKMFQRMDAGEETLGHWIVYGAVGVCFIFHKALCALIGRGNLNISAGINKTIGGM